MLEILSNDIEKKLGSLIIQEFFLSSTSLGLLPNDCSAVDKDQKRFLRCMVLDFFDSAIKKVNYRSEIHKSLS